MISRLGKGKPQDHGRQIISCFLQAGQDSVFRRSSAVTVLLGMTVRRAAVGEIRIPALPFGFHPFPVPHDPIQSRTGKVEAVSARTLVTRPVPVSCLLR